MKTTKPLPYGPDHANFRNGKTISHGYVVLSSKMWGEDRGRYEHRVIMERLIGRPLLPSEIVHHRNGIKTDNQPENLELLPNRAAHNREHGSGRILHCTVCGAEKWYTPTLLRRMANVAEYKCRPCSRREPYTRTCGRCGGFYQGGMTSLYCGQCTQKNRGRRFSKLS